MKTAASITRVEGLDFLRLLLSTLADPLRPFVDLARNGGDIVYLHLGQAETYFVNSPEVVRHVLVTNQANYVRSTLLDDLEPFLGRGIFMSDGPDWLHKRRLVNPVVHRRFESDHIRILHDELERMRTIWTAGAVVDVQRAVKSLMLHVMVRTMFAPDLRIDAERTIEALDVILEHASLKSNFKRRLRRSFGMNGPEPSRAVTEALDIVNSLIRDVIHRTRTARLAPGRLLAQLLACEKAGETTDKAIRDEMATFLFAGFDTTAEAAAWALFLLAQHPHAQDRLRTEADRHGEVTVQNIDDLPFTYSVALEALRLYPSAWSFHRTSKAPDRIGEIEIPVNAHLMFCPFAMHRHPAYWADPEAFDPARFFSGSAVDPFVSYAFLPFGHGGRACLGRRLALVESRVILAHLVRHNRLEADVDKSPKIDPGIILHARGGLPVRVYPIDPHLEASERILRHPQRV